MKRWVCLIWVMLLMAGTVWGDAAVAVTLDGQAIPMNAETGIPYIDTTGRTLVPMRAVLERAGITVSYDAVQRVVTAVRGEVEVLVPIGQNYVMVNRVLKVNDAPAVIRNGRTFLPIRIVMEAFGYEVGWNPEARAVSIVSPVAPETPVPAEEPAAPTVNTEGNTSVNLFNGGLMAKEGDWFYFVNFSDDERIWRLNLRTGDRNAVSQRKGRGINVVDGTVYYREENIGGHWNLFIADGAGKKPVHQGVGEVSWLKVTDGMLYYYLPEERDLVRKPLADLEAKSFYGGELSAISLENGYLTYAQMEEDSEGDAVPGDILRVKLDGMQEQTVLTDRTGETEALAVMIGERLYYSRYDSAYSLYYRVPGASDSVRVNDFWTRNLTGDAEAVMTLGMDDGLLRIYDAATGAERQVRTSWRPGIYYDPALTLIGRDVFFIEKTGARGYRWVRVNRDTGKVTRIDGIDDFLKP